MTTTKKITRALTISNLCFWAWVICSYIDVIANNTASTPLYEAFNFFAIIGG